MEEINQLIQERIKKLNRLRDSGIEPYGAPFTAKDRAAGLIDKFGGLSKEELEANVGENSLAGRVISFRDFGKTAFAHIQDESGRIQVYFAKDIINANKDIFRNPTSSHYYDVDESVLDQIRSEISRPNFFFSLSITICK